METLKKAWRLLASMHFAIFLLILLAAACSAGSLVTQGQTYMWYAQRYSERTAALIIALHLDDAFHSWWFILITAFLCLNLLLCNVLRAPQLIRRSRRWGGPPVSDPAPSYDASAVCASEEEARGLLGRLGMRNIRESGSGEKILYACKNRAGLWGAWVCHLGILFLIAGYSLGQMNMQQYTVYGVPGETREIGDSGYMLHIDDFRTDYNEDGSVRQYASDITVWPGRDPESAASATVSVNAPAGLFGMKYYQNSTGWAGSIHILKDGAPLMDAVICAGDMIRVPGKEDLVIILNVFYPDYQAVPGSAPVTLSNEVRNPAWLYSAYYQERLLGMNVLMGDEPLTIDEYTITFTDPRNYTLIQVKRDPFTLLALIGGVIAMAGLLLAFYVQPARAWASETGDGSWQVFGNCPKGGALFRKRFAAAAEKQTE